MRDSTLKRKKNGAAAEGRVKSVRSSAVESTRVSVCSVDLRRTVLLLAGCRGKKGNRGEGAAIVITLPPDWTCFCFSLLLFFFFSTGYHLFQAGFLVGLSLSLFFLGGFQSW